MNEIIAKFQTHNLFWLNLSQFIEVDPHLMALSQLVYQYEHYWWSELGLETPGIYILTGGRQVGKSTSCKALIKHSLEKQYFNPENIFYLPCDEIFDAKEFSKVLRSFLECVTSESFLLIVDEVTYVKDWDRVIKALADEGYFTRGLCLLTGSDTLVLKESAMRFPGRRGTANKVDFHLYPLAFADYVDLVHPQDTELGQVALDEYFTNYLQCGGYLRAINDYANSGTINEATYLTYEQWIRGDFLKHGKNEEYLLALLYALMTIGVSQISYSTLQQKTGLMSKETCIDYCRLLERMDILFTLQAFDQNKKQGFPKKDRKFHFLDPFIQQMIVRWLQREAYEGIVINESGLVESCVASHCHRVSATYYFKGRGEIDVLCLDSGRIYAIEVKWSQQVRPNDLKALAHFENAYVVSRKPNTYQQNNINYMPVSKFLMDFRFMG